MGNCRVPVSVNPFTLIFDGDGSTQHPDILLSRLCAFGGLPGAAIGTIANLHAEVAKVASEPPIVPHDNGELYSKIVIPLHSAKVTLVLGHYVATVALCGMACEMLAVLVLRGLDLRVGGKPMCEERQKSLFGRTFERLQQDRRVRILYALNAIDEESRSAFNIVRETRNKYIHVNPLQNHDAKSDAMTTYARSIGLLAHFISAAFTRGKMEMNPVLFAHLKKQGVVEEIEDDAS